MRPTQQVAHLGKHSVLATLIKLLERTHIHQNKMGFIQAKRGGYHHREVPLIGSDPPILKQPKRTQVGTSTVPQTTGVVIPITNYWNTTLSVDPDFQTAAPFAESLTAPKRVQQPVSSGSFSSKAVKETFSQQFHMQKLLASVVEKLPNFSEVSVFHIL